MRKRGAIEGQGGTEPIDASSARGAEPRSESVAEHLLRALAKQGAGSNRGPELLQAIAEGLAWDATALWTVDRGARHLRCDGFWARPGLDLDRLRAAHEGTLLPVGVGLPGRVWESGRPELVSDLSDDVTWPLAPVAAASCLRSAFAFPVLAGGRFLGVVELFDRSLREIDRPVVETMEGLGSVLGEFLERLRQDEERERLLVRLQTERARLAAVQRRMPAGVLVANATGRVVAGNDMLEELVGPALATEADGEQVLDYPFRRADGRAYRADELPFTAAARTGAHSEDTELEFLGPDGEIRLVCVSAAPVHDPEGRVVSAVATFHDVTHRRRTEDRHRFLSEASAALARSLDHETTLAEVVRSAVGVLGDAVVVHLVGADAHVRQVAVAYDDHELDELAERFRTRQLAAGTSPAVTQVLRTGESIVHESVDDDLLQAMAQDDEHLALLSRLQPRSVMVIPLLAGHQAIGALTFVSLTPTRVFDEHTVSLAEELGRRVGSVVANVRLYERERAVAHTLQRSLLPRELPAVDGLELAARFHAGGEGVQVGGDIYDVFPIDSGATALVIGDVCGKGADAAARAAQFRYTTRALSGSDLDPAMVLARVDAKVQETDARGEPFCTAVYVRAERRGADIACTAASAGHPLPLVVRAGGGIEDVPCEGPLLFVVSDPVHKVAHVTLHPGDALVLYTDGVTEARGVDGWFGEGRLRALLATCVGASADEIAARITAAVLDFGAGTATDDVAVLVAVAR